MIKSFYSTLHIIILPNIKTPDAIKIIVYSFTGFLYAVLLTYLKRLKVFRQIIYHVNNKSINDDIFDEIYTPLQPENILYKIRRWIKLNILKR